MDLEESSICIPFPCLCVGTTNMTEPERVVLGTSVMERVPPVWRMSSY